MHTSAIPTCCPDGEVGFLDWQVVRRGDWSQDVGYFLVGSLAEQDRRRSESKLLELYRTALDVPDGERPSKDQAWPRYRATPAYGLAIWLSTLGTDGWQRPEVSLALAQRYATAFVELESESALAMNSHAHGYSSRLERRREYEASETPSSCLRY